MIRCENLEGGWLWVADNIWRASHPQWWKKSYDQSQHVGVTRVEAAWTLMGSQSFLFLFASWRHSNALRTRQLLVAPPPCLHWKTSAGVHVAAFSGPVESSVTPTEGRLWCEHPTTRPDSRVVWAAGWRPHRECEHGFSCCFWLVLPPVGSGAAAPRSNLELHLFP